MSICSQPTPLSIWELIWNSLWKNRFNFIWRLYNWWRWRNFAKKINFPGISQIFPELFTKDLVDIQPMSGPIGKIFYVDFIYKKKKWYQFWEKR